ncbi:MAG: class I SAM-dependent methyltransferase [Acidobacteria bacterium]|nr:class I SAM-dependent methyltransferase [Acidobacteriota bacterium]
MNTTIAGAAAYDALMGRWSKIVAQDFVTWLAMSASCRWLDVGCGTGALTTVIISAASPSEVWGIDPSEEYIAYARDTLAHDRCHFLVADAQVLPGQLVGFDAAVSALALNLVAEPRTALAEMTRVTRPGGVVAVYVWDFAGEMQLLRYLWNVATELDPAARDLDQATCFPICHPDRLRELFEGVGLTEVQVQPINIPTVFRNFDDYWSPFLTGHGRAAGYVMSLDDQLRSTLRDCLRAVLPINADGSIHLTARAWACRGVKARQPLGEAA